MTLADDVRAHEGWYHTMELAPGVVTPGWFDTRSILDRLPWPSLRGLRCLDVGTFDGFWAFEMERRGASSVTALDVDDRREWDWPANTSEPVRDHFLRGPDQGSGFAIAKAALGSKVERVAGSVYSLSPERMGQFDFVYVGSLLLHLRDPIGALEAVRSVCRGEALVVDAIDLFLTFIAPTSPAAWLDGNQRPWWWKPNQAGLCRMLESAGWTIATRPVRFFMPAGAGQPVPPFRGRMLMSRHGREILLRTRKGDPHAALLARPVRDSPRTVP